MALRRLSTSSLTNPKWYRDGSAGLGPYTDFELIDETVLTTSAASVTFSNLGDYSTIYKHLQIRAVHRSTRAAENDSFGIRLNGDTGTNYAFHRLYGTGTSVVSNGYASQNSGWGGESTGATATTNAFFGAVIDILDAYANKNKTMRALSGGASSFNNVQLTSSVWLNTASLTSINLFMVNGGNFIAGSEFALFGIKGA